MLDNRVIERNRQETDDERFEKEESEQFGPQGNTDHVESVGLTIPVPGGDGRARVLSPSMRRILPQRIHEVHGGGGHDSLLLQ